MTEPEKQTTLLTFTVPDGYRERERLDVYLTGFIQNATRAKVQKGIKEGLVRVNGGVASRPSQPIQPGDEIVCTLLKAPPMDILPEEIPLDIRFEDDHLLVVNKPAGMVVHPAYGHRSGTLVHALLHHVGGGPILVDTSGDADGESGVDDDGDADEETGLSTINAAPRFEGDMALRPGIIHRLDKDTSGLLVVAKHDLAHVGLSRQFAQRSTRRYYLAILWGLPEPSKGTIRTDLARDIRDRRKMAAVAEGKGKHAVTHYEVLEPFGYTSLARFRLETGRTHQIRVHAQYIGHSIFGDPVYDGDRVRFGRDEGQRKTFYRNLFEALPRQALHAASLGFRHPVTGEELDFEAELPPDMEHVLDRLRSFDLVRQ
ncbi:MAG: RluA family pseudouridine synthase [Bacteroidetes bacterium]|nr:RluA family pseudouridine synthase [Bacteroidota bacterium]MDA0873833.1 RluA family pseudouridine synthase [Bacteroidota bacterium]